MARINSLGNFLTDVADAIRNKKGTSAAINAEDFDTEIESITTNPNLQSKSVTITSNTTTTISADSNYDGLDTVSVTTLVPGSTTPTNGYIVTNWSNDGAPLELTVYGYATVPRGLFKGTANYDYNFSKVTNIILPNGFGRNQTSNVDNFSYMYALQTVDTSALSTNSMNLGWYAFQNCTSLQTLDLSKMAFLPQDCFNGCTSFDVSSIPSTMTSIGKRVFSGCTSLTLSSLPDTITHIDEGAFNNCSNITLSKLPDSLTTLYGTAFANCKKITVSKMPDGVTSFGSSGATNHFAGCTGITSMDLNNLQNVSTNCFSGCTNLQTVTGSKVTEIRQSGFDGCSSLTSVSFPLVTTSNQYAFRNCTSLTSANLPLLTTIYYAYFFGCTSLTDVNIDGATTINWGSFTNCTSLKKLALPSATSIQGNNVSYTPFTGCTGLKKVWIGSSITNSGLQRYSFAPCTNLETIYIDLPRATVTGFSNYQYAFMNNTSKTGIIVCNDDAGFITKAQFDELVVE